MEKNSLLSREKFEDENAFLIHDQIRFKYFDKLISIVLYQSQSQSKSQSEQLHIISVSFLPVQYFHISTNENRRKKPLQPAGNRKRK